jgi:mono/diheme cytochrome c family protein
MRVQAIRASETLYKRGDRSFAEDYRAMTKDADADVALQALLTANLFRLPDIETLITETMAANQARGIQEIGKQLQQRIANAATTAAAGYSPDQLQQMKEGEGIYRSLCNTCHGDDGRGVVVAGAPASGSAPMMGPPLAGSPRVQGHRDYVIKTLLHGMTGPLAGQTFTQVMLPMGAQTDQWIANIASYVRNSFGNAASFVGPADVARVRAATADRKTMWTYPELEASLPRLLPADPSWKASASHNADRARSGLTLAAWTTAAPQEPGMWFQVELPEPAMITEIHFDSGAPGGRGAGRGAFFGRGGPAGRGRGAQPGAGPGQAGRAGTGRGPAGPGGGRIGGPPPFGSYPIEYRVQVSTDGLTWSTPVAETKGSPATIVATFAPVRAKFVRVTQTGSGDSALPWSVLNFRVYAAGDRTSQQEDRR